MKGVAPRCLVLLAAMPALAQTTAFVHSSTMPMAGSMVFDSRRNVVVVFEQPNTGRTWDWDGVAFRRRLGPASAAWRVSNPVYDPDRGEIHVAIDYGVATWNGANWRLSPTPTTWVLGSMAWDRGRRRLVSLSHPDVAEWDGAQWSRITPPSSPGPGGALVFDPIRGRCVLAQGNPVSLWTWDGGSWTPLSANGPAATVGTLAVEPTGTRLILYGWTATAAVTWAFDSPGWTQIATPALFTRDSSSLAWDGTGILRLGGYSQVPEGLWRLEGNVWRRLPIEHPRPRGRPGLAATPHRPEALLFGGSVSWQTFLGDTWTFDGAWHPHNPPQSPSARQGHGLAWSATAQLFVLFGGEDAAGQLQNDTWTWNGVTWTQHLLTPAPPARSDMAMTSDPTGGALLLGGMTANSSRLTDHWRWQPGAWLNIGPAPGLAVNSSTPLATHDPARNRTVAVIGWETWEWDGATWTQHANVPLNSTGGSLVFRPDTQAILFYPAPGFSTPTMAEWDGTQWTQRNIAGNNSSQAYPPMLVPDFANQRVWSPWHAYASASWNGCAAVLTTTPATADRFGYGCALGAAPGLVTDGSPRAGNPGFAIDAATLAANAPLLLGLGTAVQGQHLGSGCVAWIAQPPVIAFALADAAGYARFRVPIPADNNLRGFEFVAQAAVVDPVRSLILGLSLTDGLRIRVGD